MGQTLFEGPEKKLEIMVTAGTPSLRETGDDVWASVVREAKAEILSTMRNEHCDAYLLSESSLFVFDDYLVMITCGCTTLIDAVKRILAFVDPESIELLVYERKNQHFPAEQPTTFLEDARQLAGWLPGRAVRFGGDKGHHVDMFCASLPTVRDRDDMTLEVLMHGIDPSVAREFVAGTTEPSLAAAVGLGPLLEGFSVSEHVFSPVGYSLNALRGEEYFTIHVTPEAVGSYVSVETNTDFRANASALVTELVAVFRPVAFDVVTFLPDDAVTIDVPDYRLSDRVASKLGGYNVHFMQFHQPPSAVRTPREFDL